MLPSMLLRAMALAFALLLSTGCAHRKAPASRAAADDLHARQEGFLAAMSARNAETVSAHFAEDAELHVAGMPAVRGQAAIERFYGNVFRSLASSSATPLTTRIASGRDMAYTLGRVTNVFESPEGAREVVGKFTLLWERRGDEWSIVAYTISSDGENRPTSRAERDVDLSRFFAGGQPVEATFVLHNAHSGETVRHNRARARERFIPASTFKIPNSLIGLETGVITDADFTIRYDTAYRRDTGFWSAAWARDHTLRSAFQVSAIWYYQELARRVGGARMREYLERFDYGNRDPGGGIDQFWLTGELRISPDEQIDFLRRFHDGALGASPRSTDIVKSIMVLEETPEYTLRGKTGLAQVTPTREMAWLVGYLERGDDLFFFALNMEGEEVWERWGPGTLRRELVKDLMRELGALPPDVVD